MYELLLLVGQPIPPMLRVALKLLLPTNKRHLGSLLEICRRGGHFGQRSFPPLSSLVCDVSSEDVAGAVLAPLSVAYGAATAEAGAPRRCRAINNTVR